MRKTLAIALLPLAITACGGGSSTTANPTPIIQVATDVVAAASASVAAQIGAMTVPGTTSTTQAYDVVADLGDTWRILLNQDGSYTIKVLSSQFGLTDINGTYSQTTNGDFVAFAEANGKFALILDKRTKTIAGTVTLGSKVSTVAGSGYAMPTDLSKLAGDYVYFGSTRNVATGSSQAVSGGSFRIAANGTDITLCDGGLVNATGSCTAIAGAPSANQLALTLAKNSTNNLTQVKNGTADFGILSLQAGDRGAVLVIDRFGYSQSTPSVLRAGAFYAVKQHPLGGHEADGKWVCSDRGTIVGTLSVNGTAVQATNTAGQISNETFNYNTALGSAANGFVTSVANGGALADDVLFIPLSSSLAVVERDSVQSSAVCYLKS
ncbi:MAG: hypothetical protein ACI9ZF_001608 [Bradyrhizobium sp.]|jgi:hypothetical protein